MFSCALFLVLSATPDPTAAVLVGRRTTIDAPTAQAAADQLDALLVGAKVSIAVPAKDVSAALARRGLKDASLCNGRRACLAELGRQLGVTHVVAMSVGQLGEERSTGLELVRVEDEVVVAKDAIITSGDHTLTAALVQRFLDLTTKQLVTVKEVPREPALTPTPKEPPLVVVTPPPPPPQPKSHAAGIALSIGGLAALGLGVGMLVSGLTLSAEATRSTTIDGRARSALTASAAQQKADAANVQLGVAVGAGVAALGLGTGAVLAW